MLSFGLAVSVAQAPKKEAGPKSASDVIKGLGKKVRDSAFSEKAVLEALTECEQTALELRKTSLWTSSHLSPKASSAVKKQTLKTLAAIGDPSSVFPVTKVLDDPDDEVIVQAAITLWNLPPHRKPIPKLTDLCKHKNPRVRHAVVSALGRYAMFYREALPPVIAALDDNEAIAKGNPNTVRNVALLRLRFCGPDAKEAVPRIIRLIETEHEHEAQRAAISALAHIAPAEPILVSISKDWLQKSKTNAILRNHASGILIQIGEHGKSAVPDLLAVFEMTDDAKDVLYKGINGSILQHLQKLGPHAKEALPTLTKLAAQTNDRMCREEIEKTIRAIRGEK